jgi:hypothetical protein
VGTQVLVYDGHNWACKYWSVRGMSGHESAAPLKGMLDLSSVGILTYVKSIVTILRAIGHRV